MKPISVVNSLLMMVFAIGAAGVMADETSKQAVAPAPPAPAPYEANRGLLTLEGPTGLFINPTSATLPKGAYTAQYCFFLPDSDFKGTIGHGFLISYGITDWLEFGGIGNIVQDAPGTLGAGGPHVRLRLLKHKGLIPQFSIGSYGKIGDDALEQASIYAVFTERFELNFGPLVSVALDAGMRQTWAREVSALKLNVLNDTNDSIRGYFGLEVQFPARIYAIGEVATESSFDEVIPWAAGLQWRAGGVNVSAAAVQPGSRDVGFFFGIGTQLHF
jgi:hypothetical protein